MSTEHWGTLSCSGYHVYSFSFYPDSRKLLKALFYKHRYTIYSYIYVYDDPNVDISSEFQSEILRINAAVDTLRVHYFFSIGGLD